jgi:Transposase and inactivated derivatives
MSKRLRRLYHFFSHAKPGSRNREELLLKIKREFEKQNNKKRDIINKVVHFVTTNYSKVVLQDDNIRSWQKLFGEKIYETSIGGIRNALKRKASTPVEVGRFVKTTGVCPVCRTYVKLNMHQREFTCPSCNSTFDRDVASAIVILKEGLSLWNVGETPGDENASAMLEYFASIPHVSVSMNREALPVRTR